jgi:hypothetical protein
MQHTRTPTGAVSIRFRMFDLMATMFCHVAASSGREMLQNKVSDGTMATLRQAAREVSMKQGFEST